MSFTAPAGTQVARLRLWRTAWSYGSGSGASAQRNYLYTLADGNNQLGGDDFDGTEDVPYGRAGKIGRAHV